MKLCITYITTGKYKIFYETFIKSYISNFCTDHDRTFFIFTDNIKEIKDRTDKIDLKNTKIKFFDVSVDSTGSIDYIKYRKFKMLNEAEVYYSEFDYVFYFNGNLICNSLVRLDELFPNDTELYAVEHSLFDRKTKPMLDALCKNKSCAAYFNVNDFKDTYRYFQAGNIGCTSIRWKRMTNFIESCRHFDEYYGTFRYVPWHDETYYNKYINILLKQELNKVNILNGKIYLCSWLKELEPYVKKSKMLLLWKEYFWNQNNSN